MELPGGILGAWLGQLGGLEASCSTLCRARVGCGKQWVRARLVQAQWRMTDFSNHCEGKEPMRILAIECDVPDAGGDGFTADLLRAEALCAWQLYQEGIVRELYFRADRTEAVILLECASVDEARAALERLPLVQAGLVAFDFIPLKAYPGFERLFAAPSTDGRR